MSEISDLNVIDASNVEHFPEGQTPSSVNDGARAVLGLLARGLKDTIDGYIATAGTSTAYTVAANRTITAYYDGLTQCVAWHTNSGASPTINIDSLGAKALVFPNQTAVGSGKLTAGARALVQYDSANDNFMVLTEAGRQRDVITTRGDTIRGDTNGAAERLALGASGTYLKSNGSDAVWASVACEFIATADAASNATLDFTAFDATKFDAYLFVVSNLVPATDTVNLYVRTSTDGGSNFDSAASDYRWIAGNRDDNDADDTWNTRGQTTAQIQLNILTTLGSAAGEDGFSGEILVLGPHLAKRTALLWKGIYWTTAGILAMSTGGAVRDAAEDVNALRFLMSSGNIESGTITMYGLRNA